MKKILISLLTFSSSVFGLTIPKSLPDYKHSSSHSKNYIDASIYSNMYLFKTGLGPYQGFFSAAPWIELSNRVYPIRKSHMGSEKILSLSYLEKFKGYDMPVVECKAGALYYLQPKKDSSLYFGVGGGVGFPRILPVYISIGEEYHIHNQYSSKVELSFSTSGVPTKKFLKYGTVMKFSYGFGF